MAHKTSAVARKLHERKTYQNIATTLWLFWIASPHPTEKIANAIPSVQRTLAFRLFTLITSKTQYPCRSHCHRYRDDSTGS